MFAHIDCTVSLDLRSRIRSVAAALLLVTLTAACADGPPPPSGPTARDSSGIRVVEAIEVRPAEQGWTVDPEPVFRLGWEAGDPPLQAVSVGSIQADGGVVIGDAGAGELHWIGPEGDVQATVGRPGEGPGEFSGISAIVALGGDSVLVQDDGNLRVNVFAGTNLAADERFEPYFANAMYGVMSRTATGAFVLRPESLVARALQGQEGWVSYPVLRVDRQFQRVDTLVELGIMHMRAPDDRNPIRHWGSVDVAGDRLIYAESSRAEVRWFDLEGALTQIARLDMAAEEADEEMWARYESNLRGRLEGRDPADIEERVAHARRDFEGPRPYFNRAYGDAVGNVWLSRYDITGVASETYTVVEADALGAHRVVLPASVRVLDISEDRILGVETDAFDVQAVVVYRIRKD